MSFNVLRTFKEEGNSVKNNICPFDLYYSVLLCTSFMVFGRKPFFRKEVILLNYRNPICLIFLFDCILVLYFSTAIRQFWNFSSSLFLLGDHLNRISIIAKRSFRNPIRLLLHIYKKTALRPSDTIISIQLSTELLCLPVCSSRLNGSFKVLVYYIVITYYV